MARRRLASLLGLSSEEAALLIASARERLGRRGYAVRLAALLLATAPAVRCALPAQLRRRSVRPFVYGLVSGPSENLLYARVHPSHSATADD